MLKKLVLTTLFIANCMAADQNIELQAKPTVSDLVQAGIGCCLIPPLTGISAGLLTMSADWGNFFASLAAIGCLTNLAGHIGHKAFNAKTGSNIRKVGAIAALCYMAKSFMPVFSQNYTAVPSYLFRLDLRV